MENIRPYKHRLNPTSGFVFGTLEPVKKDQDPTV